MGCGVVLAPSSAGVAVRATEITLRKRRFGVARSGRHKASVPQTMLLAVFARCQLDALVVRDSPVSKRYMEIVSHESRGEAIRHPSTQRAGTNLSSRQKIGTTVVLRRAEWLIHLERTKSNQ